MQGRERRDEHFIFSFSQLFARPAGHWSWPSFFAGHAPKAARVDFEEAMVIYSAFMLPKSDDMLRQRGDPTRGAHLLTGRRLLGCSMYAAGEGSSHSHRG